MARLRSKSNPVDMRSLDSVPTKLFCRVPNYDIVANMREAKCERRIDWQSAYSETGYASAEPA